MSFNNFKRINIFNLFSFSCIFLSVLLVENVSGLTRLDPLVDTNVGLIRGLLAEDGDYAMFLGIPYGVVNGSNPFGAAITQPNFATTFEAYDDSAVCPQIFQSTIRGTLDCLHLNIYVPSSASSQNPLPVMIWIHGGSFMHGFSGRTLYGPKFLVKHNVVLVTVNYRVGAYGFMCLDIPSVPGNQGLKDQLLALKWIKENIGSFGGDSNKITLFGESAGGHSVDFHLISPKDKLYDQVILQSGSVYAATVLYEPDKNAPIKMAEYLGYKTDDLQQALEYLAMTNSDSVIDSVINTGILFKPCVEKDHPDAFIIRSWLQKNLHVPKVNGMPVLLGFNENELMFSHINRDESHFSNIDIIRKYLDRIFIFNEGELEEMKEIIQHFYFGGEDITQNLEWSVVDFDSDFTYIHPIQRTLKNYLENNAGNTFYYMFSYAGERNYYKKFIFNFTSLPGASHADELGYLFDSEILSQVSNDEDLLIVERMTKMWTNFAKTGDPTPDTSDPLLPIKWLPVTKKTYNYLNINTEMKLERRPLSKRMAFWDIFYELNEHLQRGFVH
ncbi:hypothetical protein K1T71_004835 [Dendrolimus kikuchii]|uniref:Uncharacterized protein n=1 Tax=Dendrolimus kikuchii TaxID=765133 RepID=A0ACC1D5B4_9NEOP|nr:hypothetical protein K1T71_004835 [Dendrolimus kikuchii]